MGQIKFPDVSFESVKGVLLDLDNTLYIYEPCHQKALKECYQLLNQSLSFEQFVELYSKHRQIIRDRLLPQGACRSRLLAFQELFEDLGEKKTFEKAVVFNHCYWSTLIQVMHLEKEAESFLLECEQRQIPVCVVSDMLTYWQIQKLQALRVDHLISYLVTSEEAGVEKPFSEIFHLALSKLALSAEDVIMIGDDVQKDIEGAQRLGIRSFQVKVG